MQSLFLPDSSFFILDGILYPILINCSQETILLETAQKEKLFCHIPHKKFTKDHFFSIPTVDVQFYPINLDQIFVILTLQSHNHMVLCWSFYQHLHTAFLKF